VIDELVANAAVHAAGFRHGDLPLQPSRRLAVLACMDARLDISAILGLRVGEAHVIRNAGGLASDDMIRSLSLSQRHLGTRSIMLVHHTKCGMYAIGDEEFRASLREELGIDPTWSVPTSRDVEQGVRDSIELIRNSPFIPYTEDIRGFVYDVSDGVLSEIS
jgi:carbonic anhydrase